MVLVKTATAEGSDFSKTSYLDEQVLSSLNSFAAAPLKSQRFCMCWFCWDSTKTGLADLAFSGFRGKSEKEQEDTASQRQTLSITLAVTAFFCGRAALDGCGAWNSIGTTSWKVLPLMQSILVLVSVLALLNSTTYLSTISIISILACLLLLIFKRHLSFLNPFPLVILLNHPVHSNANYNSCFPNFSSSTFSFNF